MADPKFYESPGKRVRSAFYAPGGYGEEYDQWWEDNPPEDVGAAQLTGEPEREALRMQEPAAIPDPSRAGTRRRLSPGPTQTPFYNLGQIGASVTGQGPTLSRYIAANLGDRYLGGSEGFRRAARPTTAGEQRLRSALEPRLNQRQRYEAQHLERFQQRRT